MDLETIKQFVSFGIGGLIAIVTMWWKRLDDKDNQANLNGVLDRTLKAIDGLTTAIRSIQSSVEVMISLRRLEEELLGLKREVKSSGESK